MFLFLLGLAAIACAWGLLATWMDNKAVEQRLRYELERKHIELEALKIAAGIDPKAQIK